MSISLNYYNSIKIVKNHLSMIFETFTHTTIEAKNSLEIISDIKQEPLLDMEGNDTNTTTQEPVLAIKQNHVVTKEPVVNSKFVP
jgi:hypothetical protein